MFHSARIKLTGWYLLIIMLISGLFSVVLYMGVSMEMERSFRQAERRLEKQDFLEEHFPNSRMHPLLNDRVLENPPSRLLFVDDFEAAKRAFKFQLLVLNGIILVMSAVAGYFLAGKTLYPIETAMEEQKRFVTDASHELRTPLTALKTTMEVALRDKKISIKDARDVLQSGLEEVESLEFLTSNLLGLARFDLKRDDFVFKKVNLKEIVESAVKKLSPLAKKKGVKIELRLENCFLKGDEEKLEKMVIVFLDNAVKYTPKGGRVTVLTRIKRKCVEMIFADTGMGINAKDLPCIFDRFFRADQSRTKNRKSGFGLGLSLAKETINGHRGTVSVKSKVNAGTTFKVKLPIGF